ncbi:hypothetical protein [Roseovarius rhodophyticola]|uniref:Lipoprotein n=1 Tax=Roseovarius rhodophyticola TaxID=3080827 RepID=A0ABZ2TDZ4_9RHOB|nr:hypothetical protein [Roseovarius sp. W115]MDV2928123.1 hypothetical protein [Roseovarius sp. W115]
MRKYFIPIVITGLLTAQLAWSCDTALDSLQAAISSDAPLSLPDATCQQSVDLSGATKETCHWTYPYRTPEAEAAFTQWSDALLVCFGAEQAQLSDQPVNHPDSYTLHRFDTGTAQVSLSLKDKAALGRTLVFLQISPKP